MSFEFISVAGVLVATALAGLAFAGKRRRQRRGHGRDVMQPAAVDVHPTSPADHGRARSLALDAISEAVLIVQEDGRVRDCNSAALTLFFRHRSNVEDVFVSSLRTLDAEDAAAQRTARERGIWSGESWVRLPDGSLTLCLTRIVPLRDGRGRITMFCESYRDTVGEQLVSRELRDRLYGVQPSERANGNAPAPHVSLARLGASFRDLESLIQRYEQVIDSLSTQDLAEPLAGLVHELRESQSSDSTKALLREIPTILAALRARFTRGTKVRSGA